MWTGLYPGKPEDDVPIGHITNGVHVPSWLAPQMFRLYDRHLGTGWHEHSGEADIWEGIENVDDGELWETHLSLKVAAAGIRAPPRRANRPSAAANPREMLQRLGRVLSPDALTIGFARRFATYKRANLILADIEAPGVHGERSQAAGAVRLRRQGASRATSPASASCSRSPN